jgi:hypothetical protein
LLNLYEGDLLLALAAYNAGVHRVKGGKIPRIRETRLYVRKVLRHYEHYREPRRCGRSAPPVPCRSAAVPHSRNKQTRCYSRVRANRDPAQSPASAVASPSKSYTMWLH